MFRRVDRWVGRVRRHRTSVIAVSDAVVLALSYGVLGTLRYEYGDVPWSGISVIAATAIGVHLLLCWTLKLYRGRAAIASTEETVLLGVVAVTTALVVSMVNLVPLQHLVARSLPLGAAFTAVAFMVLARALWRRGTTRAGWRSNEQARRALIVGAGAAGQQLVRSMLTVADSPLHPVGLIDDDPWKRHLRLDGVEVAGTLADLEVVAERADVRTVVVAIPTATSDLIAKVSGRATAIGRDVKVLPPVRDLLGEPVSIRDVRDVDVADLLGRTAVETDVEAIAPSLTDKRVLVTGAGGSIGSELAPRIAEWHPAELMMLDRDESGLHAVQLGMRGRALLDSPDVILCDIRDACAVHQVFMERRPEVVFHAAALKHLPMLEQYPAEAVKTNVIGTANVLEAARRVGAERFVNISTDKAADPTSVLGYSKRAAERITADYAGRSPGTYLSVRFGNVLGSRGSVLTAFAAQIARGGPVTVTHPEVTRYFMTVSEAVQLVLQAGAIGNDGEVLILDMGDPVRVDDVARALIRRSGQDIAIVYTGLRAGEKLNEVLRSHHELDHRPHHELISHVPVPALAADLATSTTLPEDPAGVRDLLRRWCAVDGRRALRAVHPLLPDLDQRGVVPDDRRR